jgi:hypothetical protein
MRVRGPPGEAPDNVVDAHLGNHGGALRGHERGEPLIPQFHVFCPPQIVSDFRDPARIDAMPLTPDDAIERNKGKKNLQFERAIQDLAAEVEEALAYYTGNPVYVGLPAYLQYKAQADNAMHAGAITMEAVDRALEERFNPSGWKVSIVTTKTESYYWAKLVDARKG